MNDATSGGPSDDGRVSPRRLVGVAVALLLLAVVLIAVAYYAGFLGRPTVGVVDRGEWGDVSEEHVEVITTVWVRNPNPFGERVGDRLSAEYDVRLNGVRIAEGNRSDLPLPPGNTTFELRSVVENDRLDDWWVAFLRGDETLRAAVDVTLAVDAPSSASSTVERDWTMLADERPILDALSGAARRIEGRYVRTVSLDAHLADRVEGLTGTRPGTLTVGYEVRQARATWGTVSENRTTVEYRLRVYNPGDVPVVASPRGVRATVAANDVRLLESNASSLSLGDIGPEETLAPGESRTLSFELTMDNDRIDDWFRSHVRRGERSSVTARLRLLFEVPVTGGTLGLPADSPVIYDCSFRTSILVDDQSTGSDCGNAPNGDGSVREW